MFKYLRTNHCLRISKRILTKFPISSGFPLLLFCSHALAAPSPLEVVDVEPVAPDATFELEKTEVQTQAEIEALEWSRAVVSEYVESLNDGMDSFFMGAFFDDEIINDESSGSNGRLFFSTRRVEGEGVDYQSGINLKLVLPNTRDRFKVLVETDENDDETKETNALGTTDNVTYSTSIRVEIREGRRWKTSWDNGVRWEAEPVYFSRLRARRTDYFDDWRSRLLQSAYWRTDDGWGAKLRASLMRPIDLRRHFTTSFNADYLLDNDFAELENSMAIFDELSYKHAMLYRFAILGDTEGLTKVNSYVTTVSYRRKIYKSFVFAEVVPELAWPRERDYSLTPAISFRLEMIFGPDSY